MSELLPCPFCGKEAAHGHIRYSRPLSDTSWADETPITEAFYVNCVWCGAVCRSGLVGGFQTEAEAAERWNTRANQLCVVPSVEVIARAVFFCHFASSADAQSMMDKEWGKPSPLMDMVQREATAIHNLLSGEA